VQRFIVRISAENLLFEASVIRRVHILHGKCLSVLQTFGAQRLTGKFYVTDPSSNAMHSCLKAFAVVCTSSQRPNNLSKSTLHRLICVTLRHNSCFIFVCWMESFHGFEWKGKTNQSPAKVALRLSSEINAALMGRMRLGLDAVLVVKYTGIACFPDRICSLNSLFSRTYQFCLSIILNNPKLTKTIF